MIAISRISTAIVNSVIDRSRVALVYEIETDIAHEVHLRHGCASDSKGAFVLRAGAQGFDALPEIGCDPSGIAGAHGFDEINIAELSIVFYRLV